MLKNESFFTSISFTLVPDNYLKYQCKVCEISD